MRDDDTLILENLYINILLRESTDEEYLTLAHDPEKNREELQRMVDDAAKSADFTIKAYRIDSRSTLTATGSGKVKGGIFLGGEMHGRVFSDDGSPISKENFKTFYVRINNPYHTPNGQYWVPFNGKKIPSITDFISVGFDGIIQVFPRLDENGDESDIYTKEFIVFSPNQVKSIALISYDDNKEIIPLSQRFDLTKDDLRY